MDIIYFEFSKSFDTWTITKQELAKWTTTTVENWLNHWTPKFLMDGWLLVIRQPH